MRVLFVSGHPDDHMTSAGFLSLLKKKGHELFEVVLTGGSGGYVNAADKESIVATRESEFEKASALLGMKKTYLLGYDEHDLLLNQENVEALTKIVREVNPQIIIIPNRDDYHETHVETNRIATKAIRTAMKRRKLELGEPVQPLVVLEWEHSVPKQPDVVVDVSSEQDLKRRLLECYGSQLTVHDKNKLEGLNRYRGSIIECEFGEGFKMNRFIPLRLDKVLKLLEM